MTTNYIHHNITINGIDRNDDTGSALGSGDLNGDFINDIIIAAPSAYGPNNSRDGCGEVHVIFGNSTPSPIIDLNSPSDIIFYGVEIYDHLGSAIAIGDVNSDGFDDLLLGVHGEDGIGNEKLMCGGIYIIYGNVSLPSIWDFATTPANVTIYGADVYDRIGETIAIGDINGDGIDDIITGITYGDGPSNNRPYCGEVYIIYGNASLPSIIDLAVFNTSNYTLIYGAETDDYLGKSVTAGDVNFDGYDDIIISGPRGDGVNNSISYCGEVHIFFGNSSSSLQSSIDLLLTSANVTIYGKYRDCIGNEVTSGDLNGDNFDDIIISTTGGDGPYNNRTGCGEVYIIYGNTTFPSNISTSEADVIIYGQDDFDGMSGGLETGDGNGDGYDDLVIGVPDAGGPNNWR
ncbi:MAG: FG-GAP repeat protein, partial [Thermoplasmata archaeon]|nr:FG-GAP repeat protein [Thermoplasmata archaeon]